MCTGLLIDWSAHKDQYNPCVMSGLTVVHPYKDPIVLLSSFEGLTDMSMHDVCSTAVKRRRFEFPVPLLVIALCGIFGLALLRHVRFESVNLNVKMFRTIERYARCRHSVRTAHFDTHRHLLPHGAKGEDQLV
jgi:hypothetical protein